MADAKQDKTTTQQASDAKPAPAPVTPMSIGELTDEALASVPGGAWSKARS